MGGVMAGVLLEVSPAPICFVALLLTLARQ